MIQEADKNHDEVANFIAWSCFLAKTHDGHNYFSPKDEETMEAALKIAAGNDYGHSLMTLMGWKDSSGQRGG